MKKQELARWRACMCRVWVGMPRKVRASLGVGEGDHFHLLCGCAFGGDISWLSMGDRQGLSERATWAGMGGGRDGCARKPERSSGQANAWQEIQEEAIITCETLRSCTVADCIRPRGGAVDFLKRDRALTSSQAARIRSARRTSSACATPFIQCAEPMSAPALRGVGGGPAMLPTR